MPVDDAMRFYKDRIVETKVRSPHTPSTGGRPGTRNWGQRAEFDVKFGENLMREHERDSEEAGRAFERFQSGVYADDKDEEG
jgi:hypothetical protein